mmetsp:Transcript_58694/g.137368  ORF Transcript_58694/g.137368 Transcript_58694/m.137368 type:complete len:350 (-) Transcript_58694:115-1164(-)
MQSSQERQHLYENYVEHMPSCSIRKGAFCISELPQKNFGTEDEIRKAAHVLEAHVNRPVSHWADERTIPPEGCDHGPEENPLWWTKPKETSDKDGIQCQQCRRGLVAAVLRTRSRTELHAEGIPGVESDTVDAMSLARFELSGPAAYLYFETATTPTNDTGVPGSNADARVSSIGATANDSGVSRTVQAMTTKAIASHGYPVTTWAALSAPGSALAFSKVSVVPQERGPAAQHGRATTVRGGSEEMEVVAGNDYGSPHNHVRQLQSSADSGLTSRTVATSLLSFFNICIGILVPPDVGICWRRPILIANHLDFAAGSRELREASDKPIYGPENLLIQALAAQGARWICI